MTLWYDGAAALQQTDLRAINASHVPYRAPLNKVERESDKQPKRRAQPRPSRLCAGWVTHQKPQRYRRIKGPHTTLFLRPVCSKRYISQLAFEISNTGVQNIYFVLLHQSLHLQCTGPLLLLWKLEDLVLVGKGSSHAMEHKLIKV